MLVLERREGQVLTIGDDIFVTVLRISNRSVRIGIEAPKHISIIREEAVNQEKKDSYNK